MAIDFSVLEKVSSPKFADEKLGKVITDVLPIVFSLAGIILLISLLSGGLQIMLSKGEPKALEAAKSKITNAILGVFILSGAYLLVGLISKFLGISIVDQLIK